MDSILRSDNLLKLTEKLHLRRVLWACISLALILAYAYNWFTLKFDLVRPETWSFHYTELMINFEAGYVRRGLFGQLLYWFLGATGLDPFYMIQAICILAYLAIVVYMLVKFRQQHFCWWILVSPLLLGHTWTMIRKDYLMLLTVLIVVALLRRERPGPWRVIAAIACSLFAQMLHEVYFFWGTPVLLLILYSRPDTRRYTIWAAVLSALCFMQACLFHGSLEKAHGIVESWQRLEGPDFIEYRSFNAIGAIGWDTKNTFIEHFTLNFHSDTIGWWAFPLQSLYWLAIYYLVINFPFTFRGDNSDVPDSQKTAMSALYMIISVTMLPVFLILSCDYDRLYMYMVMSVYITMVTLQPERFRELLPKRIMRFASRFNAAIDRVVKPRKWLLVVMLFFVVAPLENVEYIPSFVRSPMHSLIGEINNIALRLQGY